MNEYKVAGYVKLAKLWEKNRDRAMSYHRNYYDKKYQELSEYRLYDVYIDITGAKKIENRPEMVRLISDCFDGRVDCIAVQTKGYLAADTREFCYLFKLLSEIRDGIHIITEDDNYNINTVVNADGQKEALLEMADKYIALNPSDYEKWKTSLLEKCNLGGGNL